MAYDPKAEDATSPPPSPFTYYVNQLQLIDAEGNLFPWEDACAGHDELYDAMACQDHQIEVEHGKAESLSGLLLSKLIGAKQYRSIQHRIVKRTVTVIEETAKRTMTVVEEVIETAAELKR